MPYIKPEYREKIDSHLQPLAEELLSVGDLNYAITRLVCMFLISGGLHYEEINAVAGVLQKVTAEFDVRVTRPYEELKIFQNGDIPEFNKIEKLIRDQQRALPIQIAPDTEQAHG